jgi:hypothetical protein
MTSEALDAIIAAVGREPADRAKLAAHLNSVHSTIRHNRKTKHYSLKSIRTAIEEVARMVDSSPAARSLAPELAPEIAAILEKVRRLGATSKAKGRGLSLTDFLCGEMLRWIFEEQFGARATIAPNGAYVRFAGAALKAGGEKVEPGTIIRSMTAARRWAKNHPEFVRARGEVKKLTKDSPILKAMLEASIPRVGKN